MEHIQEHVHLDSLGLWPEEAKDKEPWLPPDLRPRHRTTWDEFI